MIVTPYPYLHWRQANTNNVKKMGSVIIHIHFRGIYLKKFKKFKNYSQYATMIIQLNINEI